ncbi:MAG TPA: transporter [Chitinophagaceae bacterium]|nr:transporter [Chitinophagaceae bacterium]
MTKEIACVLTFLFFLKELKSQETGRMETDRPDQTESPVITKTNFLQGEIGFNYEKAFGLATLVHPTALWKYGVAKRFEIRVITEIASIESPLVIPYGNKYDNGLLPIQIGGKLALTEEKKGLPKTSLIFHVAPNKLGSKKFRTSKWAPNFRFTMQHTLSEAVGLGYNLGAEWDGESGSPYWIYTIAPGFNIGKNWYAYIELFGAVKNNEKPQHAADGGIACYLSDNSKIDLSGGIGLSKESFDHYIAIGYSFRLNTKRKSKSSANK